MHNIRKSALRIQRGCRVWLQGVAAGSGGRLAPQRAQGMLEGSLFPLQVWQHEARKQGEAAAERLESRRST